MLGLWPESNLAVEQHLLVSLQHHLLFARSLAARARTAWALIAETSEQHPMPFSPDEVEPRERRAQNDRST